MPSEGVIELFLVNSGSLKSPWTLWVILVRCHLSLGTSLTCKSLTFLITLFLALFLILSPSLSAFVASSFPLPSSFTSLLNLERLEIQRNNISGKFPDLGSLKSLYFIDGSDNNFSRQLPSKLPKSLMELSMRNNNLEGNLPHNFQELEYLQVLDLSHNLLSGPLLPILFDHPSLEQLTLSYNNFSLLLVPPATGFTSKLIAIDLSHNSLGGLLPSFLGSMPKLSALNLEHNRFTGMIPAEYALRAVTRRRKTSSFERLLLGGNYLFGPIPGPLMILKRGTANVSLVDNCLYRCPETFFFCQGGDQKSLMDCKSIWPAIP
ncbi:Leucine-rich repeat (LRR) family protein [Euphorbia peplus]|nr:Leucine-rich repeat (LRR) family protein [Euphorbia peplus]